MAVMDPEFFTELSMASAKVGAFSELWEMLLGLSNLRQRNGRLFVIGVGGGAANASHAVNDFRKLCDISAFAPSDNVSELTARANDEGWETIFTGWLQRAKVTKLDGLLVFSVGGGTSEVSQCVADAVHMVKKVGAPIWGVVGSDSGVTAKEGDHVIVVPVTDKHFLTPVTETMQLAVVHFLVSNPLLQTRDTKW